MHAGPIGTSLSRPAPRHSFCVIGSDNAAGEERGDHFLMCVDWTTPKRDIKSIALPEVCEYFAHFTLIVFFSQCTTYIGLPMIW